MSNQRCRRQSPFNPLMGTGNYSAHRIIWSWYTGRWWVGCYIWYSDERPGMPLHDSPRFTHVYGKMHQRISAIFLDLRAVFSIWLRNYAAKIRQLSFFFDKKIRFATILNFVKLWPRKQKWTFWTSLPLLKERVQKPKAYLSGCSPFAIFMEDLVMPAHWTSGV